jgi:hypothetical protein
MIGAFIFQFSQLEFTVRVMVNGILNLTEEPFDIVTSPYDFSMLCGVTESLFDNGSLNPREHESSASSASAAN